MSALRGICYGKNHQNIQDRTTPFGRSERGIDERLPLHLSVDRRGVKGLEDPPSGRNRRPDRPERRTAEDRRQLQPKRPGVEHISGELRSRSGSPV